MPSLDEIVAKISQELRDLKPGPLAELRRMEPGLTGTPAFWRLAARLELNQEQIDRWQQVVRIMAILSPKGDPEQRQPVHDGQRPLGAVLADGGDKDWATPPGGEPRPVLSEARFARFLALAPAARGPALERIARALARTRPPEHGVNCSEIAALLLTSDQTRPLQRLARDYYSRLDRATRASAEERTA